MAEEEALGRARRPPAERLGEDDRVGVLGAAKTRCACLHAAALGRAHRADHAARLLDAGRARQGRKARRPVRAGAARATVAQPGAQGSAVIVAVDWVAVSSIVTAGATLVLAIAT